MLPSTPPDGPSGFSMRKKRSSLDACTVPSLKNEASLTSRMYSRTRLSLSAACDGSCSKVGLSSQYSSPPGLSPSRGGPERTTGTHTEKLLVSTDTVPATTSTANGTIVPVEPASSITSTRMSSGAALAGSSEKSNGRTTVTAERNTVPEGRRSIAGPAAWSSLLGGAGVTADEIDTGSVEASAPGGTETDAP